MLVVVGVGVLAVTRADRSSARPASSGRCSCSPSSPASAMPVIGCCGAAASQGSHRRPGDRLARAGRGALLALGALAAGSAWAAAEGSGAVVAGVVILIGACSRPPRCAARAPAGSCCRRSPSPGRSGIVCRRDVSFDGGVGERIHRPATVADIPRDGYRLGAGRPRGRPPQRRAARDGRDGARREHRPRRDRGARPARHLHPHRHARRRRVRRGRRPDVGRLRRRLRGPRQRHGRAAAAGRAARRPRRLEVSDARDVVREGSQHRSSPATDTSAADACEQLETASAG